MPRKTRALRRGTALSRSEKKQVGPVQIVVLGFASKTSRFKATFFPSYGGSATWRSYDSLAW